jgi:hypothetical protein
VDQHFFEEAINRVCPVSVVQYDDITKAVHEPYVDRPSRRSGEHQRILSVYYNTTPQRLGRFCRLGWKPDVQRLFRLSLER